MKGRLSMPDATEKPIEAIRKCPNLYDHSRKEYRDTDIKDRVLQTIADSLNIPGLKGGDVWTRWRTLRDTYVKKKREIVSSKKSESETKTKNNWKYMAILQFLDPYVQEASTDSNFPESKSTFYEEQTSVDTESVVDSQRDTSDDEHNCETQVSQPPPASGSPVGCDTPDLHSQCYPETIHQYIKLENGTPSYRSMLRAKGGHR